MYKKIESLIQKAQNKIGQIIATKTDNIILKNNRFKVITNISEVLDDKGNRISNNYSVKSSRTLTVMSFMFIFFFFVYLIIEIVI